MGSGDLKARIAAQLAGTRPSATLEDWPLPEQSSDELRRLRATLAAAPVPAAVLIPIVERESGLQVLLTRRASHMKYHGGQISFPGGRVEARDVDAVAAALRETHEEIGLESRFVEVVGFLPDHLIVTGYRVTPVVGFIRPGFDLALDAREVVETFEVPLMHILDPANRQARVRQFGDFSVPFQDILFGSHVIWGATAAMLISFGRIVAHDR